MSGICIFNSHLHYYNNRMQTTASSTCLANSTLPIHSIPQRQAIEQLSSNKESVHVMAAVAVILCVHHPDLLHLIRAHMYERMPALVPIPGHLIKWVIREGKGREGKGREGKGREGKGREGIPGLF